MMRILTIVLVITLASCSNSGNSEAKSADSSYKSITDSSALVKDSLPIPGEQTPHLSH